MNPKRSLATLAFAIPLLFGITDTATSQEAPFPEEVLEVLRDMGSYLEEADEFTISADIHFDEILPSGQAIQHGAEITAAVERPSKLAARYVGEDNTRGLWLSGTDMTLLQETAGVYSRIEVPEGTKNALDHLMEKYDISLPLADFVIDGVYESLVANIDNAIYTGKSEVNGESCHHIACSQEFIDWQLWIDDGLQPLPRKVLITYKSVPGMPRYTAVFNEWNLDAEFSDSVFEPNLPAGARKIDLLEIKRSTE